MTIIFNYMTLPLLRKKGGEYFSHFTVSELENLRARDYAIYYQKEKDTAVVPIVEVIHTPLLDEVYAEVCQQCGREKLDSVLIEPDDPRTREKIKNAINTMMENCTELDIVLVSGYHTPAMTDMIYSVLLENFRIKQQDIQLHQNSTIITIERREDS